MLQVVPNQAPPGQLEAALAFAEMGWPVFPLRAGDKRPAVKDWPNTATTDADIIRGWWRTWPAANVAIVTGSRSGLYVVDIDIKDKAKDGAAALEALTAAHGPLAITPTVRTASGGLHYYFRHVAGLANTGSKIAPGIDTRGDGGYVVAPPSVLEGGADYSWLVSLEDVTIAALPAWLLELVRPTAAKPATLPTAPATLPQPAKTESGEYWLRRALEHGGARNETGLWLCAQLRDAGLSATEAKWLILSYQQSVAHQGGHEYTEAEALATLKSVYSRPAREPARKRGSAATSTPAAAPSPEAGTDTDRHDRHDMGNAHRLARAHGENLRYCDGTGKWYAWDGGRWAQGNSVLVKQFAMDTVTRIYDEAAAATTLREKEAVAKWAAQSAHGSRIREMVNLAEALCSIEHQELDSHERTQYLLNVENGTLDLLTGELRPHNRRDYITKRAAVRYEPAAQCPTWLQFLERTMGGDAEVIEYLQRAVGYALTGDTTEHVFFMLYGSGRNGKSTFVETIRTMLGDYAETAQTDAFMAKDNQGGSNAIAALRGARYVSAVESQDGRRLDAGLVKQLTGGDMVSARFLYREYFQFRPSFKWFLATNHLPKARGDDMALFERVRLIPFTVTIPEHERDRYLSDKLRAELPGILNWALAGVLAWKAQNGLGYPDKIRRAVAGYRSDMDSIAGFLDERCVVESGARVNATELYKAYQAWCDEAGEYTTLPQRLFGSRLRERGFKDYRGAYSRGYEGLRLLGAQDSRD